MPRAAVLLLSACALVAPACGGDDDGGGNGDGDAPGRSDSGAGVTDGGEDRIDGGDPIDSGPTQDASVVECAANGTGSVTSTTAGVEVAPVVSTWYLEFEPGRSLIAIDERPSACDPDAVRDQIGHWVTIFFCDDLSMGTYQVVADLPDACPGDRIAGVVVQDEEFEEDVRTASGTVTIDSWAGCVVGSFDTTTDLGEELSGTFEAYRCAQ